MHRLFSGSVFGGRAPLGGSAVGGVWSKLKQAKALVLAAVVMGMVALAAPTHAYATSYTAFTDPTASGGSGVLPTYDVVIGDAVSTLGPILLALVGIMVLVSIVWWVIRAVLRFFGARGTHH